MTAATFVSFACIHCSRLHTEPNMAGWVVADAAKPSCNDLDLWEVFLKAHPGSHGLKLEWERKWLEFQRLHGIVLIEHLLVQLAHDRWIELRRKHNRAFSTHGPGTSWDAYKRKHSLEYPEIEVLQQYCLDHLSIIDLLGLRGQISDYNGVPS